MIVNLRYMVLANPNHVSFLNFSIHAHPCLYNCPSRDHEDMSCKMFDYIRDLVSVHMSCKMFDYIRDLVSVHMSCKMFDYIRDLCVYTCPARCSTT